MSGIAAVFARDGRPLEPRAVWAMLDAVPYRGPDGQQVRLDASVGLGHARLAMTAEEETELQPLVSPRTGCLLVADVRLDNRDALLAQLPERPPAETTDAELLLRAYETWGVEAVKRLLGDFAFVIWDPRRQRLLCARDSSGQRSLFYRADARSFVAASEIHQLLQDPSVPIAPNEERIRGFLVPFNFQRNEMDQAETFYAGIASLPAGHVLLVDAHSLSVQQYWRLEPGAELRYRRDADYAEHYRALLFEVVRARLRGSRPIGALLSGGLDSSSIVCTAQELYRRGQASDHGFVSLSVVFDGWDCDEQSFIEEIQAKYGFDARYIAGAQVTRPLPLEARGFMEAPYLGAGETYHNIFREATRAGVRALLTGDCADACVAGSPLVFDSLLRQGRLRELATRLRAYRRTSGDSLRKTLALYCAAPLLPLSLQRRVMIAQTRRELEWARWRLLPTWMSPALRTELSARHLHLAVEAERQRRFASPARHLEHHLLAPPEVARHPAPWAVEMRRPFADRRLHEFLLAIPPEQKFMPRPDSDEYYAGSKQIVRRAMRGMLPERLRTRTAKAHFDAVFENDLARQWPNYESAFGPATAPQIVARGYVDKDLFWQRLQELRAGEYSGDQLYVLEMVGLEVWLRSLELPRAQLVTIAPPATSTETIEARPAVVV